MSQTTLFNVTQMEPTGKELARVGMDRAIKTTQNLVDENWPDKAFAILEKYINERGMGYEFQNEQFRLYAESKGLPAPVSARAYGGIVSRAAHRGLIKKNGTRETINASAHGCYASVWQIISLERIKKGA